jgi:RNA polymerase sigma-70 factor (ECF subfamily)
MTSQSERQGVSRALDVNRLESYRAYLGLIARLQLDHRLLKKVDASDLVQQTFVKSLQGLERFRGQTGAELGAWLRQILARTLANALRDQHRDKRDCFKERSLDAAMEASSARLEAWLADPHSSPTLQAERNERLLRLSAALMQLPEPQREAIVLHHLQGLTVDAVADQLGRSASAVAGLVKRGMKQLRLALLPAG